MSRIKPIKSVTYKGKKYTTSMIIDMGNPPKDGALIFDIIFMVAQGAYPTYLFTEIEKRHGYQHELEIEASNHNAYKSDRINHPEWWDYKVWKCLPSGNRAQDEVRVRFEKRLKYKRLEKLESLNPKV